MNNYILIFILFFYGCSNLSVQDDNIVESNIVLDENNNNEGDKSMVSKTYTSPPEMLIDSSKSYTAVIETSVGSMNVEFYTDTAPNTVNNFIFLARDGYYDNVIFHRVISGFMIQGGDPSGTGHGDMGTYPGYKFSDELDNPIPYERGILAMANAGPNTNGSQFFVMHQDYPLPYQYSIFGKVTEGFEVIDKIAATQTDASDRPVEDITIIKISIYEE